MPARLFHRIEHLIHETKRDGVLCGLHLDANEGRALFLGFDDAGGLAVDVEHVIREAVAFRELKLSYGDPAVGGDVRVHRVADDPACRREQPIDLLAGRCFWFRQFVLVAIGARRILRGFVLIPRIVYRFQRVVCAAHVSCADPGRKPAKTDSSKTACK